MSRKSTMVYSELKDLRPIKRKVATIKVLCDEKTPTNSLTCGFAVLNPGQKSSLHYHECEEAQYILYGYGIIRDYEGREHPARPGVVLYCPAGINGAHGFENTSDIPLGWLFIFPALKGKWPEIKPVEE